MSTQPLIGYGGYTPEELQAIMRRAHAERAKAMREMFAALLAWRRKAAGRRACSPRRPEDRGLPLTTCRVATTRCRPTSEPEGGCHDVQHTHHIRHAVRLQPASPRTGSASILKSWWEAYWTRRAKRTAVLMLRSLDDHCLHDIGVDRSEIEFVVYGKPGDRRLRYERD